MAELKSQLEEKSSAIAALEDEIKVIKRKKGPSKKNETQSKEEISNYEIKSRAEIFMKHFTIYLGNNI